MQYLFTGIGNQQKKHVPNKKNILIKYHLIKKKEYDITYKWEILTSENCFIDY